LTYRFELIQFIINKYNLKKYLEIGVGTGLAFSRIKCELKVGVDPAIKDCIRTGEVLYALTSDNFFRGSKEKFDIVFIDGLHLYEQTIRDIVNSWNCLNENGWIVIHDCLPRNAEMCTRKRNTDEWTGDVWKAIVWFRKMYASIECYVLDMDYGCGVIRKDSSEVSIKDYLWLEELDFEWLQKNKEQLNVKRGL